MKTYVWIVLCGLALGLVGCGDVGFANDVVKRQDRQRMNQSVPGPTELPPGLGDDLPASSATSPTAEAPATQPDIKN